MSPQSTAFSLIAIASFFSSSIALPLDVPQLLPRSYSIVNVDGSSSPATLSTPPTVTQTIVNTVTASGATPIIIAPGTTPIVTVNVDSATKTVYVTVAPTPTSTPSAPLPSMIPNGYDYPPLNSNSTMTSTSNCTTSSSSKTAVIPSAAKASKSTPKAVGDGAPWGHGYTASPTGAYSTAYTTGSYSAPVAASSSGTTAPLPVLPPAAPYWFNVTEVHNARRWTVVS